VYAAVDPVFFCTSISSSEPAAEIADDAVRDCWMPETTPSAESFASRGPDRISMLGPQMRSPWR